MGVVASLCPEMSGFFRFCTFLSEFLSVSFGWTEWTGIGVCSGALLVATWAEVEPLVGSVGVGAFGAG